MRKHKRKLYMSRSHAASLLLELQNELKMFEDHFAKFTVKLEPKKWHVNRPVQSC